MIARYALLAALALPALPASAQSAAQKGRFEVLWGWNRDTYSASDIRFHGNGYDFSLQDVKAVDRPLSFGIDFFDPVGLTLPQTNLRINWHLDEKWVLGIAFDHMKYVMVQDQEVAVQGTLPAEAPVTPEDLVDGRITLTRDLLTYEHTDGLNFMNARIERRQRLLRVDALRMDAQAAAGVALGVLVPRTACRLPGKALNDEYHLRGWGLGAHAGARLVFFDWLLLAGELQGGRIALPDVRTSSVITDRASQGFWYYEAVAMFGVSFRLAHAKGDVDQRNSSR